MNILQTDSEKLINTIERGREPILDTEEIVAINAYAMKSSPKITPLLR